MIPASRARSSVDRRVVDQDVDPDLHAAGDLVVGAVELVVREADLRQPLARVRVGVGGAVAGDVDEVALLVPGGIVSTAPGYGSAASTCSGRWVSLTHAFSCSGSSRSIAHVYCVSYGSSTPKRALRDLGELVPVGVQRRVDVDREAHGRWYGSGVSGFLGQVRALPANAFVRSSPDPTYADGDDSTWTTVDWPSLTRTEMVLGRARQRDRHRPATARRCCSCTGSAGCGRTGCSTSRRSWTRFRVIAPDLPGFGGSEMPSGRISIQGFARVIDALCERLEISSRRSSSATRWAGSSGPSWRWRSRRGCASSC